MAESQTELVPIAEDPSAESDGASSAMQAPTKASETNGYAGPYKFLDYYSEDDEKKFAGRERDIRMLSAQITKSRAMVLYGRSGLGKTSLLLAGVFPALRRAGYLPIYVRTLESPVDDLISAVLANAPNEESSSADMGEQLVAALHSLSKSSPVVIVLDQFEEFFIRFQAQKGRRRAFISTVVKIIRETTIDARFVFSLREEWLAALDDFRDDLPDLFANAHRLNPLTAFGARQAILQPLLQAGITYDRRLINAIMDVLDQKNYDPPLLQILCTEVYRASVARTGGEPHLTAEDLREVEGVEGVFQRYLSNLIEEVPKALSFLSKVVLETMITKERTKDAVKMADLRGREFKASPVELQEVLRHLVKAKLVRPEPRGSETWYELIHERLVEIIERWLMDDNEYFRYRQAANNIINMSRGDVWKGQNNPALMMPLGVIEDGVGPFRERLRLTDDQAEFMVRSCIVFQSDHVSYWASVLGAPRSKELTLLLLRSGETDTKIGAAYAAPKVAADDSALADACLDVAMTDESEEVRRAMGRALAQIAQDKQLSALRQKIDDGSTRSRGLEVLSDLLR